MLNVDILESMLKHLALRPHITKDEVVDTFRQYQDFINSKYQIARINDEEFEKRDESCRKALNILLYGVIEKEGK